MPPLAGFDALKTRRARSLRTPAGRRNSSTCTRKSSRSSSVSDDSDAPPSSSSGSHPPCSGRGHTASDGERARGRQAGGRTQRRASARATLARAHPRRTHAGSTCTRACAIPRAPLHRASTPCPPAAYRPHDAPLLLLAIAESAVLGSWILPVRKRCSKQCVVWCSELTKSRRLNF